MAIKFRAKSKEEIPAELQGLYVERDGAWVLDVEGAVERSKVDEFRDANVALRRERDEIKRRFERSESEQVQAVVAERDALNARLTAIQIDQGVTAAASKRGLRPTAIPDITARARSVFRLEKGVPTAFEADGQTVRMGKDGLTPLNLEEWVDLQVADAPHLFESNAGGGAAGDASGGGAGARAGRSARNPFRKETWNLTEQMKLQKSDPQLAARLRAAA
ncbi:MAG TPA: hypothetical protein P5205_22175 [Candidatus Paceibacterota bacterium]|nr:hypothetical protein [Candidatus Paceibacterota bacterium]HSA13068.1 hypothetical protein [Candidatus Paceibacterota bacterium]